MTPLKARVRRLLKEQERSISWLARQLGMNETLLHHYLSARRPAPADLYERIAEVLRVHVSMVAPQPEQVAA